MVQVSVNVIVVVTALRSLGFGSLADSPRSAHANFSFRCNDEATCPAAHVFLVKELGGTSD